MSNITLQKISKLKPIPTKKQLSIWANQVLPANKKNHEIVIRIVNGKESAQINKEYRKKTGPTNIISFPFEPPVGIKINTEILGDLVICAPLVKQEAKLQQKTSQAHWAHLIIHGVLHLLGHDHQNNKEAEKMERLEIKHLKKLGFDDPYN